MAMNNQNLANALATKKTEVSADLAFQKNLGSWYKNNFKKMITYLGDKTNTDLLIVSVVDVCSKNPALLKCTPESLYDCILKSASLNLFPGPMQECAYVPFKGKATFIPQYQGLIKLIKNYDRSIQVEANVVYEKDTFEYEEGLNTKLRHIPNFDVEDRGKAVCAWCVIKTDKGSQLVVRGVKYLNMIRDRSPAYRNAESNGEKNSPWHTDLEIMQIKSVIRAGSKFIPKSPKLAEALIADDEAETDDDSKNKKMFDLDPSILNLGIGAGVIDVSPPKDESEPNGDIS